MFNFEKTKRVGANELLSISKILSKLDKPKGRKHFILNSSKLALKHYRQDQVEQIKQWANGRGDLYIYYFLALEGSNIEEIRQRFENAKKGKDRAYPRINKPEKISRYLYVGSSQNIASRFKEHLGDGNKKTYALQLYHWCAGLNFDIDFYCMKFDPETEPAAIQAFEDAMWEDLNPLFGRRGAR